MAVLEKVAEDPREEQTESNEKADDRRTKQRNEKSMKNINTAKDALLPLTDKTLPYWETTKYAYHRRRPDSTQRILWNF